MAIRVLLADDHEPALSALGEILRGLAGVEVVAVAMDGREAVRLAAEFLPDVVLMDIVMPGTNGMEATRQILSANGEIKVIAVSMHAETLFVERMRAAGASGYLLKDEAVAELPQALRAVVAGRLYFSSR
jgi:LuxR family maltose regulon positive regulatory protein